MREWLSRLWDRLMVFMYVPVNYDPTDEDEPVNPFVDSADSEVIYNLLMSLINSVWALAAVDAEKAGEATRQILMGGVFVFTGLNLPGILGTAYELSRIQQELLDDPEQLDSMIGTDWTQVNEDGKKSLRMEMKSFLREGFDGDRNAAAGVVNLTYDFYAEHATDEEDTLGVQAAVSLIAFALVSISHTYHLNVIPQLADVTAANEGSVDD